MRTTLFLLGALLVACTIAAPIESSSATAATRGPHSERFLKKIRKGVKKVGRKVKKVTKKVTKKVAKVVKHYAICNRATKSAFASAFVTAVSAPVIKKRCQPMSASEWRRVGCGFPPAFRHTRVCAPAVWGGILGKVFKARAMALKTKILFRNGITRAYLFNTSEGRALMRHELQHIRQQSHTSAYRFGYNYISGYCRAGRSYKNNYYEVDARKYQKDVC